MAFYYTVRSEPCSAIIKEASSFSKQEQIETHTLLLFREYLEHSALNSSSPGLREHWKKRQKDYKGQENEG